jgi:hypothetical protein
MADVAAVAVVPSVELKRIIIAAVWVNYLRGYSAGKGRIKIIPSLFFPLCSDVSSEQVLGGMKNAGCRPPYIEELVAIGADLPPIAQSFPVIGLRWVTPNTSLVPVIERGALHFRLVSPLWSQRTCFVGVPEI